MKFAIIKSCLARFSGIFAVGTPSNIHGTAISYRCAKFGAFFNSVTILTLRDLTMTSYERRQVLFLHDREAIRRSSHSPIDNCSLFIRQQEYKSRVTSYKYRLCSHSLEQSRRQYSFFSRSPKPACGFKQLHNKRPR